MRSPPGVARTRRSSRISPAGDRLTRARLPNCTRLGGESGHYTGNAVGVGVDDGVNVAVGGVVAVGVQVAVAVGIAA